MKGKTVLLIALACFVAIFTLKFLRPEQQTVGPINVSIVDVNSYALPYVRVEIEDLKRSYKTTAQNFGRYFDGPFYEGKHRVVVKLGESSEEMTKVVYDKVHNFTKDTKTLGIGLENVRQRFDIEVAEQEVKIPILPYSERKDIVINHYNTGQFVQRTGVNAPVESKVLDDIEKDFHANVDGMLRDFKYVTFVRQEYPKDEWIYYVIFTNSYPEPHKRVGSIYNFTFSNPNVNFAVSQDITTMNKLSYSSPTIAMSGFTIVQTTFETKYFLPK